MRAYKLITAFGSPASLKTRAFLRWAKGVGPPYSKMPGSALSFHQLQVGENSFSNDCSIPFSNFMTDKGVNALAAGF